MVILPFLKADIASAGATSVFPPPRFKPLRGTPREVRLRYAPYIKSNGETVAQRNGLNYEAAVHDFIKARYPGYLIAPYIHFMDDGVARTAQPDGILAFEDHTFIVEIKYQHMPEAWWQLEKLYRPLCEKLWSRKEICLLEVCRSYDPAMPFPVPVTLVSELAEWCSVPRKEFGVLQWRK